MTLSPSVRPAAPVLALALAAALAGGADARTTTDEQLWVDLQVTGSLAGRLEGMVQVQPRFRDRARDRQQLLGRVGLGWRTSDRLILWLAYTHTELPIDGGPDVNEERWSAQAAWSAGNALGGAIGARTRLEHRRRSNGADTGWRLRQQVRYARPLGRGARDPALILSIEPMVELADADWGARAGLDQVRGFVGIGVPLGRRLSMEGGYLHQLVNRRQGDIQHNHVASFAFAYRY